RPCCLTQRASFPAAVVLPAPCSPASRRTVGGFDAYVMRRFSPPRVLTSSSWTILMTCWAGLRLLERSSPMACSLMRATTPLTTRKLTSASSRAKRISRRTSSTSFSPSRPRLRSRLKMVSKRSESASNIGEVRLRQVLVFDGGHSHHGWWRPSGTLQFEQVGGDQVGRVAQMAEHEALTHAGDGPAGGHGFRSFEALRRAHQAVVLGALRLGEA